MSTAQLPGSSPRRVSLYSPIAMAGAAAGSVEQASLGVAPGVEQPPNVAQWLAVLREAAPAAKKACLARWHRLDR